MPGQWFQLETGLSWNWHRTYDPAIGRYIQPDPLGLADGPSLYGYAGTNPLKYTDPSGLTRKLNPDGDGCRALLRKIQNIKNDIAKRWKEYQDNPLGLPDVGSPGSKPRASRQGHLGLIRKLEERLAELEEKYAQQCSGGGPGCPQPETAASNMSTAVGFVGGAAAVAICVLSPGLCISSAIIGGVAAAP